MRFTETIDDFGYVEQPLDFHEVRSEKQKQKQTLLLTESASMQPRTSPDKFAVSVRLASPDLGLFLA